MRQSKNSFQWFSFSMISVLLLSFTMIAFYPSSSASNKAECIELNFDLTKDLEDGETEKDLKEDAVNLFCFEIAQLKFHESSRFLNGTQTAFSIPRVFYDIRLLPPEFLIG